MTHSPHECHWKCTEKNAKNRKSWEQALHFEWQARRGEREHAREQYVEQASGDEMRGSRASSRVPLAHDYSRFLPTRELTHRLRIHMMMEKTREKTEVMSFGNLYEKGYLDLCWLDPNMALCSRLRYTLTSSANQNHRILNLLNTRRSCDKAL